MPTATEHINFDKIIDYFEDRLSEQEVQEMDALIKRDPEFAEVINTHYAGWLEDPEGYRSKLKAFQGRVYANRGRRRIRPMYPLALVAAAAIALAIVFLPGLFTSGCAVDDINCWMAEEGVYKDRLSFAGEDDLKEVNQALRTYRAGNYEAAIAALEPFSDRELSVFIKSEVEVCLGVAYLKTGALDKAEASFAPLLDNPDPAVSLEANWYLALIYLDRGKPEAAIPLLERLQNAGSKHAEAATLLLKKIS